jgi:hypothetical protein
MINQKDIKKDYLFFLYKLIRYWERFIQKHDIPAMFSKDDVSKEVYRIDNAILLELKREYKELEKEVFNGRRA